MPTFPMRGGGESERGGFRKPKSVKLGCVGGEPKKKKVSRGEKRRNLRDKGVEGGGGRRKAKGAVKTSR